MLRDFRSGLTMGMAGLISPALMPIALLGTTASAATEAHALRTRGVEYALPKNDEHLYIPWFRQNNHA